MSESKRFVIRRTRPPEWETVASFDTLEEAQAYWDSAEGSRTIHPEETGQLVDTRPEVAEKVIDYYC